MPPIQVGGARMGAVAVSGGSPEGQFGRRERERYALPAALVVIAVTAGSLLAVPSSTPQARADITHDIANARTQLSALTAKTEAATEAFNGERIRFAAAASAAAAANVKVRKAESALRLEESRHRGLASAAFGQSGLAQLSVLLSGDPQTALDRAGTIDVLARRQRVAARSLALAHHDLTDAQTEAAMALAYERQQTARLAAQKKTIEAAVSRQQTLLGVLVARQAELVREARARAAAARAAAARAEAVRQARQAEAAQAALTREAGLAQAAGTSFASAPLVATSTPAQTPAVHGSGGGAAALAAAFTKLGKPYVWGAAGPDTFDCSGLTQWAWAHAGVALGHYTGLQWNEGAKISKDQLKPGDLLFFGSDLHHVGMYVSKGKMIDAPHTGAVVRVEPIWWSQYAGAVRPTG
ncbi:MAG: C40 family peptidase [Frankia sp.]